VPADDLFVSDPDGRQRLTRIEIAALGVYAQAPTDDELEEQAITAGGQNVLADARAELSTAEERPADSTSRPPTSPRTARPDRRRTRCDAHPRKRRLQLNPISAPLHGT